MEEEPPRAAGCLLAGRSDYGLPCVEHVILFQEALFHQSVTTSSRKIIFVLISFKLFWFKSVRKSVKLDEGKPLGQQLKLRCLLMDD